MPALELLLSRAGIVHRPKLLEANQAINLILGREAFHLPSAMLIEPRDQVGSYAHIQRSVLATCENVDARLLQDPSRHPELVSGSIFVKGSARLHNGC